MIVKSFAHFGSFFRGNTYNLEQRESIHCFVINLDKDIERMKYMENQLNTMNIAFERFSAIRGDILSSEEKALLVDQESSIRRYGKSFSDGEIGCALSHKRLYEIMLERNIQKALILEDDIEISQHHFLTFLKRVAQTHDWEYIMGNYDIFDKKFRRKYLWTLPFSGIFLIKLLLIYAYIPIEFLQQKFGEICGPRYITVLRPLHLAGCYFITQEGARKLLGVSQKIEHPIDYLQNQARLRYGLKMKFIVPQLTHQKNEIFGTNTH